MSCSASALNQNAVNMLYAAKTVFFFTRDVKAENEESEMELE